MNKPISPVYTSHGQAFLNEDINIQEKLFFFKEINISKYKKDLGPEDLKIANEILNSNFENEDLSFPISNHEKFRISKFDDPTSILKYLIFRKKFYLSSKFKKIFEYPTYLLVELVSSCNLKCPMCFQSDKSFTRKPYMGIMSFELVKKIIDEADDAKIGAITFASRGEPMMHPKFIEILKLIKQKKNIFEIKINSNGTYLTEEKSRAIFENDVDVVVISADHYEKELYEKYRLGANFEDVVEKVKNFYNLRKSYKDCKTEIRVSGVDVSKNIDKKKFKDFWINYSDNVSIGDPIERWDTYNNIPDSINSACPKLWDRMYVWFDGKTNPCDEDYKSYLSYGNLNNDTIKSIWESKKLKELRDSHINSKRGEVIPCDRCGVDA